MNKDMVVFDDETVVIISSDKKTLYGKGPNTNGQLPRDFDPQNKYFSEITFPYTKHDEDKILGIYVGGSKDSRDSALFVLVSRKSGRKQIRSTGFTKLRYTAEVELYVCGQKLSSFLGVTFHDNTGKFVEVPLPQVDTTKSTEVGPSVNLPVIDLDINRNNIVLIAKLGEKYLPIWANKNAEIAYSLSAQRGMRPRLSTGVLSAAEQLAVGAPLFQPVDFPIMGDKIKRIPKHCLLAEDYMLIMTKEDLAPRSKKVRGHRDYKLYIKGENRKRVNYGYKSAIDSRFLRVTKVGFLSKTDWKTVLYSTDGSATDTSIVNAFIADDDTPYVLTKFAHYVNLSLGLSLTIPGFGRLLATALTVKGDNLLAATVHGYLVGGGSQVLGMLGRSYEAPRLEKVTYNIGQLDQTLRSKLGTTTTATKQFALFAENTTPGAELAFGSAYVRTICISQQGAYLYTNTGTLLGFGQALGLQRDLPSIIFDDDSNEIEWDSDESDASDPKDDGSITGSPSLPPSGSLQHVSPVPRGSQPGSPVPLPTMPPGMPAVFPGTPPTFMPGDFGAPPSPSSFTKGHGVPPGMDGDAWQQGRMSPVKK